MKASDAREEEGQEEEKPYSIVRQVTEPPM
jgi:hypothetical protein